MAPKTWILVWYFWTLAGSGGQSFADVSDAISAPQPSAFDPSHYIQYQEFKTLKEIESNRAKLRYKIIELDGIDYVQLQSDKGTIIVPAGPDLSRTAIHDAPCAAAEPLARDHLVLTKLEHEIGKRIEIFSGLILKTIEASCLKPEI